MTKQIASCHCGGTRIELPDSPAQATACTCSFCTKSGGLWADYAENHPAGQPGIVSDTYGRVYSASGGMNQHHFCAKCGCQTYGVSPEWTLEHIDNPALPTKTKIAVNTRLLDDFALFQALELRPIDGRNMW